MVRLNELFVQRGGFSLGPLSLSIETGVTGIIGPNGSGKSTLLKSLCGLFPVANGSIETQMGSIVNLKARERAALFSYIPQELPMAPGFSLYNFVAMGAYRYARNYLSSHQEQVMAALNKVDLCEKSQLAYQALSGGEKQRACLARALLQNSDWILMDEPASFLDYRHNYLMADMVKRLIAEEGKSFLIVSHDCDFLLHTVDRFIALQDGSLFAHTDASSVTDQKFLQELYQVPFEVDQKRGRVFVSYQSW